MDGERIVKRLRKPDVTRCVSIKVRDDGFYSFTEESDVPRDGYIFWKPTYQSGVFETLEIAEREVAGRLSWTREKILK